MKIKKVGVKPKDIEINRTCRKCSTEFSYTEKDIRFDREGSYVKCPVCGAFIGA